MVCVCVCGLCVWGVGESWKWVWGVGGMWCRDGCVESRVVCGVELVKVGGVCSGGSW
jgi:hypothetical protein